MNGLLAHRGLLLLGAQRGNGTPPTYKALGNVASATGNLSVPWPGTESNGDLAMLVVAADTSVATPSGWTLIDSETDGVSTTVCVFWKRVVTPESSVSVADVGVIQLGRIVVYSGVVAAGLPYATYVKGQLAASGTTTFPSISTVETGLKMFYVAAKDTGFPFLSGYASTSGAVTSLSERMDTGASLGTGHALAIADGTFSAGGASGTVTASNGNPGQPVAVLSIALLG